MGNVCSTCEDGKKRPSGLPAEVVPEVVLQALQQLKEQPEAQQKLNDVVNASLKDVFSFAARPPTISPENFKPTQSEQSFTNGSYYQGQMVEKKKYGHGRYISKEGRIYEGQWSNDKCDGKGHLKDLESFYYGFWENGSKQGEGYEIWHQDGTVYIGDHLNSMKNGFGVYIWKDGTRYVGQFSNDVIEGEGVFYDTDGVYKGAFVDSLQQGQGVYSYNDGAVYAGSFVEGERHGNGKITFADGSSYDGQWAEGHMHGEGIVQVRGGGKQKVTYSEGTQVKAVPM